MCVAVACANGTQVAHDGGVGRDAATPDAPVAPSGHRAASLVPGAVISKSPHYKLVGTMSAHAGTATSPSYKAKTGVVGSSQ
jgi:hypothetical protein